MFYLRTTLNVQFLYVENRNTVSQGQLDQTSRDPQEKWLLLEKWRSVLKEYLAW
jgi:hypothetical protein